MEKSKGTAGNPAATKPPPRYFELAFAVSRTKVFNTYKPLKVAKEVA